MENDLGELAYRLVVEGKNATATLTEFQRKTDKATSSTSDLSNAVFLGNLKMKALEIGADLAGRAVDFLTESVQKGADLDRLAISTYKLGENMGLAKSQIDDMVKGLEKTNTFGSNAYKTVKTFVQSGLLPMTNSLVRVNKATGETAKGMDAFVLVAKDFGASVGVSSSDAIDMLTRAIVQNKPEMLEQLGINLNMIKVYDAYAKSIGKTRMEMSAQDQAAALLNAVMAEGVKVAGEYEAVNGTAAKAMLSTKDAMNSIQEEIGRAFSPALNVAANDLLQMVKEGRELAIMLGKELQPYLPTIIQAFADVAKEVKKLGELFGFSNLTAGDLAKGLAKGLAYSLVTVANIAKLVIQVFEFLSWNIKKSLDTIGSLVNGVKSYLNMVIGIFNRFASTWNNTVGKSLNSMGKMIGADVGIKMPSLPPLATGTNYVPQDMPAFLHKGEAVVPKKYNENGKGVYGAGTKGLTQNFYIQKGVDEEVFSRQLAFQLRVM